LKQLRSLPILIAALLGSAASIGAFSLSASWERKTAILEFQERARDSAAVINADLTNAGNLLATIRAFVEASEQPMGSSKFSQFVEALHGQTLGLRDAGWAPRVAFADRDQFEKAVRRSGIADFQILEIDTDGRLVPAKPRSEYFPVLFAKSNNSATPPIGLDLAFKADRQSVIERAIALDRPAATPSLTLISVARPYGGIMVYNPAFFHGMTRGGAANRPAGLVFGAFETAIAFDNIARVKKQLSGLDIYIFDPLGEAGRRQIYWKSGAGSSRTPPAEAVLRSLPHWDGVVSIIDQNFGITILPANGILAVPLTWPALIPLPIGICLTSLFVGYLVISRRRTDQLQALASNLRMTTDRLEEHTAKISHLARHDALTDLPNRRVFVEELEKLVSHSVRGHGRVAVLLLDLDGFKSVNDRCGHAAGDLVLCEVASRLRTVIRGGDTLARLGGDEFAIIAWHENASDAASLLAMRIITTLSHPILWGKTSIEIGCSIGISIFPADSSEPSALLEAADAAMYCAKRTSRNNYRFFDPTVRNEQARC
jgi:diguanylate cyclase (GGDEF)-like protein